MNVSNIIVHSVSKEQGQPAEEVGVTLKPVELNAAPQVTHFLESVDEAYSKRTGKAYGCLEEGSNFSRLLKDYAVDSTADFVKFTHLAMSDLVRRIASEHLATGGYILFSRYSKQANQDYLLIVMIKSKDGFSFDDELELLDAQQLDLDKLHFAARIDIGNWISEDIGNHVSFVKGRSSKSVTQYFREFLSIIEFSESSHVTKELVSAVSNYYGHHLALDDDLVEEKKKLVHDYCLSKSQSDQPVFLDELSRFLDEESPSNFLNYAQEHHEIPNEFSADRTALRKFIKYSGNDKEVSVSFSSEILGGRVRYDNNNDTLTISPTPNKLRAQLT